MKEKPILFSGSMVRAILAGTKTQTRRIVKAKNTVIQGTDGVWYDADCINPGVPIKWPYAPGQRLWVRETFYCDHFEYPDIQAVEYNDPEWREQMLYYRADGESQIPEAESKIPWRPSIHMPRWASRLTLEVTDVRMERLQSISEEDARAEGCDGDCPIGYIPAYRKAPLGYHFAHIW